MWLKEQVLYCDKKKIIYRYIARQQNGGKGNLKRTTISTSELFD